MTVRLRDYQIATLDQLEARPKGRTLVVAPTGAGKGTMATELLARAHRAKKRALFVVHRREIIRDIVKRLRKADVDASTGHFAQAYVRVVSAQAAVRSQHLPGADLLVLDEAHHYAADEWGAVINKCKPKRIVGFTATPSRADGRPLGDIFDHLIESVSYAELAKRGILVPCRVLRPSVDLNGDLAQDPVEAYLQHGRSELALMFLRSVEAAKHAHMSLGLAGVASGIVHARTPKRERDATLAALENGELRVVVNVGVLTEGVDLPRVTTIVLARTCGHDSMYTQIVGRVLRSSPGKREATLIDLVGASHRHGLPGVNQQHELTKLGNEAPTYDVGDLEQRDRVSRPVHVLGVELEEVRAVLPDDVVVDHAGKPTRRRVDTSNKYAPKTRALPAERTRGFLFVSGKHWVLSYTEHGHKNRVGLCTTEEDVAQEMLALFRKDGPRALDEAVRSRRRTGCSPYFDAAKGMWCISRWNHARILRLKTRTYTVDRAEVDALVKLYKADKDSEADALIESYRMRARQARRTGDQRSRTPMFKGMKLPDYAGSKLMQKLRDAVFAFIDQPRSGAPRGEPRGFVSVEEMRRLLGRKKSDVRRALEALEERGEIVACGQDEGGDTLYCCPAVWVRAQGHGNADLARCAE